MTPLERLLAESVPDGTFGGSRATDAPSRPRRAVTALEAADHVRVLEAALDEIEGRGTGRPGRHLHAIPDRKAS